MKLTHLIPNTLLMVLTIEIFSNPVYYVVSDSTEAYNSTLQAGRSRALWWVLVKCFRLKLKGEFSIEDPVVRCVGSRMIDDYEKMITSNCANCDQYFHCKASYRAVHECGPSSKSVQLAIAGSECKAVTKISAGDTMSFKAAENGRNGNDCKNLYLCASKCSYNEQNGTCLSSTCDTSK